MTHNILTLSTEVDVSRAVRALALTTLRNSALDEGSVLVDVGTEDVDGIPTVYFVFREPGAHLKDTTRLYAD
jgi:hypothetical protein